jgi:hypothetical protein
MLAVFSIFQLGFVLVGNTCRGSRIHPNRMLSPSHRITTASQQFAVALFLQAGFLGDTAHMS